MLIGRGGTGEVVEGRRKSEGIVDESYFERKPGHCLGRLSEGKQVLCVLKQQNSTAKLVGPLSVAQMVDCNYSSHNAYPFQQARADLHYK